MADSRSHIAALTGIRAFAALWVVGFHFRNNPYIDDLLAGIPFFQYGYWGVDIFFALSGFVIAYVYEERFVHRTTWRSYFEYLALRLAHLYPLHVFTFGLFAVPVAYRFLAYGIVPPPSGLVIVYDGLMNLLLVHAWGLTDTLRWNWVSWAVSAEWFAYVFLTVPVLRGGQRRPLWVVFAVTAAAWGLYLVSIRYAEAHQIPETVFAIPRVSAGFLAGYTAYRVWRKTRVSAWLAEGLVFGSVAAIVLFTYWPRLHFLLLLPIGLLVFGLAIQGPLTARIFGNRLAVFAGRTSYSVYLVHPFIQVRFNIWTSSLGISHGLLASLGVLAAEIMCVFLASFLAYFLIEEPCRNWYRRTATASP